MAENPYKPPCEVSDEHTNDIPLRELVTIDRFDAEVKARLAKLALEEAGIRVWLENEHLADRAGVLLRVDQKDEAAAHKVLDDQAPLDYPDEDEEVFDSLDGCGDHPAPRDEPTLREEEAQRALTTAAIAWLLCPLHPLATGLLLKVVFLRKQRLAEPYRRRHGWRRQSTRPSWSVLCSSREPFWCLIGEMVRAIPKCTTQNQPLSIRWILCDRECGEIIPIKGSGVGSLWPVKIIHVEKHFRPKTPDPEHPTKSASCLSYPAQTESPACLARRPG